MSLTPVRGSFDQLGCRDVGSGAQDLPQGQDDSRPLVHQDQYCETTVIWHHGNDTVTSSMFTVAWRSWARTYNQLSVTGPLLYSVADMLLFPFYRWGN